MSPRRWEPPYPEEIRTPVPRDIADWNVIPSRPGGGAGRGDMGAPPVLPVPRVLAWPSPYDFPPGNATTFILDGGVAMVGASTVLLARLRLTIPNRSVGVIKWVAFGGNSTLSESLYPGGGPPEPRYSILVNDGPIPGWFEIGALPMAGVPGHTFVMSNIKLPAGATIQGRFSTTLGLTFDVAMSLHGWYWPLGTDAPGGGDLG